MVITFLMDQVFTIFFSTVVKFGNFKFQNEGFREFVGGPIVSTLFQILNLSNGYLKYKLATSLFSRYNPSAKHGIGLRKQLSAAYPNFADRFNQIVKPEFTFSMEFDQVNNLDFSNMEDIFFQEDLLTKTAEQITHYNTVNVFKKDSDIEVMFKSIYDQKTFVTEEQVNDKTFTVFSSVGAVPL